MTRILKIGRGENTVDIKNLLRIRSQTYFFIIFYVPVYLIKWTPYFDEIN